MKKITKCLLRAAAGIALTPLIVAAPGYTTDDKLGPLLHHHYAHRGLYTKDQSIPENSLTAFDLACEGGYGIELDVQLSKDGQVVVFHDDDLKRVCGIDRPVADLTFAELEELSLCETEEKIPLFTDVLSIVAGRAPLIVELKTGKRNQELCGKTLAILENYEGVYCVESFDPSIVFWFRMHAPHIVRGQLAMAKKDYHPNVMAGFGPYLLSNTCFNLFTRPHFIAYKVGEKAPLARLSEWMGALSVGWVTHAPEEEKPYDLSIFEWYKP